MSESGANWGRVRLGLHLVYFSVCLVLALIPAAIGLGFSEIPPITIARILLVMIVTAGVFAFVGPILCLSVPSETRSTPFIAICVMISVLTVTLRLGEDWVFRQLIAMEIDLFTFMKIVQYYLLLLGVLQTMGLIFFLLFCRQLGEYLSDVASAARATNLIKTGAAMLLLLIGAVVYDVYRPRVLPQPGQFAPRADDMALIISVVMLGVLVACLFWLISYGKLLLGLREGISRHRQGLSTASGDGAMD